MFTANQIQTNTIGVLARAGGRGQFRENRVYQCKKAGVQVEEMGDLRFEKNVVSDNVCGLAGGASLVSGGWLPACRATVPWVYHMAFVTSTSQSCESVLIPPFLPFSTEAISRCVR